ncbi:beta-1,3-galactosyltransferase 2 [Synchiropus splendidus]|uniref:beta-1,3-galactosyltransferase 2 n=1 Tax=Synchiropus splendidus TaxID=270530 RepID=UPI00237EA4E1|nr:beta-1,3-galactosyltransferase 2 [Synchiropus splendidus]
MRIRFSGRTLTFVALSALLVFSAHVLLGKDEPKPRPLPPEDFRLLSPQTYDYVLNQPDSCRPRSPFLVLMVPVAPEQRRFRDAIRRTWGAAGERTLTRFYMGAPEGGLDGSAQLELERESRQHGDVIQMTFVDSYRNLTIKTLMMMNWLSVHCPDASFAMKVDSDIFVNVPYLLRRLQRSPTLAFITGSVISDGTPRRDPGSKWHLSEDEYPEDSFPPYVSGAGYVFSLDLARHISSASRFVRMIPMEDVYVGLCLRVLGVQPVYSRTFLPPRNLFEIRKLHYDRCTFARRIIVNGFGPAELLRVWPDFSQGHADCSWI